MIYLICYDIENNTIRTRIAKTLERYGCERLQKSVFIGELNPKKYHQLYAELSAEAFDKNFADSDNIIILPTEAHLIDALRLIGNNQTLAKLKNKPNTLFF